MIERFGSQYVDVSSLHVDDGDVILLRSDPAFSEETAKQLVSEIEAANPGKRIVLVYGDITYDIRKLSREAATKLRDQLSALLDSV